MTIPAPTGALKAALRKHLQKLGKRGGTARAANLTPQQRQESAKKAAAARWPKVGDTKGN